MTPMKILFGLFCKSFLRLSECKIITIPISRNAISAGKMTWLRISRSLCLLPQSAPHLHRPHDLSKLLAYLYAWAPDRT